MVSTPWSTYQQTWPAPAACRRLSTAIRGPRESCTCRRTQTCCGALLDPDRPSCRTDPQDIEERSRRPRRLKRACRQLPDDTRFFSDVAAVLRKLFMGTSLELDGTPADMGTQLPRTGWDPLKTCLPDQQARQSRVLLGVRKKTCTLYSS